MVDMYLQPTRVPELLLPAPLELTPSLRYPTFNASAKSN